MLESPLMADDELHEVQLNGKQLVFAFMVGTVIAVVIFLCGVLVGRGLRPANATLDLAAVEPTSTIDPTQPTQPSPLPPAPSDGTPVSAQESLTYSERLESPTPLPDDLREPARPVAKPAPRPAAPAPAAAQAVRNPDLPAAAPALPEPPGNGFVVQVMAVNARGEADAVARRLTAKGYPAFVTTTGAGTSVSYRVRVGKYDTQREAEAVSTRLQKEEQFTPWVTR